MMTTSNRAPVAPVVSFTHGVTHEQESYLPEVQQLQYALTALAAAMHNADLTLTRITTSDDDVTALRASRALSLLTTCQMKFAEMIEGVQS